MYGLRYWRQVATSPQVDVLPLREILEGGRFPSAVKAFSEGRDATQLRQDLIQRINWDCGKPDISDLRQELEARLVVVGRDRFGIPAAEARSIADRLVYRVLEAATTSAGVDRVLTRSDLYQLIDTTTRISVPRSFVDSLAARLDSHVLHNLHSPVQVPSVRAVHEEGWLIDGSTIRPLEGLVSRADREAAVSQALERFHASIVVGATGLGKSLLSQSVARARASAFFLMEFRGTTVPEARARLDMLFGHLGALDSAALILDDVNCFEDPQITTSLARVVAAAERRGQDLVLTSHTKPTPIALAKLVLTADCVVQCDYLSETEINSLIEQHGGDPDRWGRLAYLSSAMGHPQLAHAFVIGMSARDWPSAERQEVVREGFTSADVEATREAARRTLHSALSTDSRILLYRLSLAVGRFERSLAFTVASVTPPILQAGERLDLLTGPWIERVGANTLRVSPMARGFGRASLSEGEQQAIHEAIAAGLLGKGTLSVDDANTIMIHAMVAKSSECLTRLAWAVMRADGEVQRTLAEYLLLFRAKSSTGPFYVHDNIVSVLLRMAQFKLAVASGDGARISGIASALLREGRSLARDERGLHFRAVAQMVVLGTVGVGRYLDGWVAELVDFGRNWGRTGGRDALFGKVDGSWVGNGASVLGRLFSIGSAQLESVEQLEAVIVQLNDVDAGTRKVLLEPIDEIAADYAVLINGPWARDDLPEGFDAGDAAERYARMAKMTRDWDVPAVAVQCTVARAIMLDEFQGDAAGAIRVLEGAIVEFGRGPTLCRALARVYLRNDDGERALTIFRKISGTVGVHNAVERAFALRDAAISAATCGDWAQAEVWFGEARSAAEEGRGRT